MRGGEISRRPVLGAVAGAARRYAFGPTLAALALLAALVGVALAASTNFSELASSPEPVGLGPIAVAAADFDGDGDRDLATANVSGGNVTIPAQQRRGRFRRAGDEPGGRRQLSERARGRRP